MIRLLLCASLLPVSLVAAPTNGQVEIRIFGPGGYTPHPVTWSDGQVIVKSGGVPTSLTLNKAAVGLDLVENTAVSTWPGTTNVVTVGTITTGTWNATAISLGKIAQGGATSGQSLVWNGSQWAPTTITSGITIGSTTISGGTSGRLLTSGSTMGELTLGSGVASWLATPSTANLNTALGVTLATTGANTFGVGQVINTGPGVGDQLLVKENGATVFKVDSTLSGVGGVVMGRSASDFVLKLVGYTDVSFTAGTSGLYINSRVAAPWFYTAADPGMPRFRADTYIGGSQFELWTSGSESGVLELRNGAHAQCLRVYGDFIDASNYERAAVRAGEGYVEFAAETAGSGDDNLDVRVTPAGTGGVILGGSTAMRKVKHGVATLVAGTVTVSDSDTKETGSAMTSTRIIVTRMTDGGTIGASYSITRSNGAAFTITSKNSSGSTETLDTSTVSWMFINP